MKKARPVVIHPAPNYVSRRGSYLSSLFAGAAAASVIHLGYVSKEYVNDYVANIWDQHRVVPPFGPNYYWPHNPAGAEPFRGYDLRDRNSIRRPMRLGIDELRKRRQAIRKGAVSDPPRYGPSRFNNINEA